MTLARITGNQAMPNFSHIKALVFDAYGTVFDVHSVHAAAERRFPGQGQALTQLWRAKQLEYMFLRSLMDRYIPHDQNTEAALRYAAKQLKLDLDAAGRAQLMAAYLKLEPFPDARDALAQLGSVRKAILSVGTAAMLEATVAHAQLTEYFEFLLSANAVGIYKPHPKVYQLAEDSLHVQREAIALVSSNYFDIAGAKNFGLAAFWINRGAGIADELGVRADAELTSLAELPTLLRP
jgi:2-haloacid dehalogenase